MKYLTAILTEKIRLISVMQRVKELKKLYPERQA